MKKTSEVSSSMCYKLFLILRKLNIIQLKLVLVPRQVLLVELAFWMVLQDILQYFLVHQWQFCIQAIAYDTANQDGVEMPLRKNLK
jgi:hypothetical protein